MRATAGAAGRPTNPPPDLCVGLSGLVEVGDEVDTVGLLLEAGEHHLGAGDVLLRVLREVFGCRRGRACAAKAKDQQQISLRTRGW